MDYIKTEFKRLVPVSLFTFLIGFTHSFGLGLSLAGLFLLAEHMYSYGRWDIKDILGHENFGIVLLCAGFLINSHFILALGSLIVYLIFSNYKWKGKTSPGRYALNKIRGIF